jgi:NitT/TauT family transport system permease protein
MRKFLPPFLFSIFAWLLLEALVQFHFLSSSLFPAPSQIAKVLVEDGDDFFAAFRDSFFHILIGWILSIFVGSAFALIFSFSDLLKRAVFPYAIFFQTVPIIAVAPLLVIYFGFGGPTVIISSFIVSVFPILANTLFGLESSTKSQRELFQLYRASSWQTLIKLKIPSAYPAWFAGVKISAGLAVIGAVAGEFVAGTGLGALIDAARTQQRTDRVFAAILILSAIACVLILFLNLSNRWLTQWRPLDEKARG